MNRTLVTLLMAIWGTWAVFVSVVVSSKVDEDLIVQRSGVVESASCIESRSVRGVGLVVRYEGEDKAVQDYIALPNDRQCDSELLALFEGSEMVVGTYDGQYFGVTVDAQEIRSIDRDLSQYNDKSITTWFSFFLAAVATAVLALSRRRKRPA